MTVDDRTGLASAYDFVNANGSEATTQQTYDRIDGFELVVAQTGSAHGKGYRADVTTTFSNYQINTEIPDGVFSR
ncbi:MAG: hypothetical protein ACREM2_03520 [Vulcanimicrobiaceae bacterium]